MRRIRTNKKQISSESQLYENNLLREAGTRCVLQFSYKSSWNSGTSEVFAQGVSSGFATAATIQFHLVPVFENLRSDSDLVQ